MHCIHKHTEGHWTLQCTALHQHELVHPGVCFDVNERKISRKRGGLCVSSICALLIKPLLYNLSLLFPLRSEGWIPTGLLIMDSEGQSSQTMSIASVKTGLGCKSYGKSLDFPGSQHHSLQPESLAAITLCPPSISSVFVRSPKLLVSGKAFGCPKDIWYTHNPKSGSTHVQWCCAGCNTFFPRPQSGHALFFFFQFRVYKRPCTFCTVPR